MRVGVHVRMRILPGGVPTREGNNPFLGMVISYHPAAKATHWGHWSGAGQGSSRCGWAGGTGLLGVVGNKCYVRIDRILSGAGRACLCANNSDSHGGTNRPPRPGRFRHMGG